MMSSVRSWLTTHRDAPRLAPGSLPKLEPLRRYDAPYTVGVLVYQGVATAEVGEPVALLAAVLDANVIHIGPQSGTIVGVEPAREVVVDVSVDNATVPDVLVLPGGIGWQRLAADIKVMGWVGHASRHTQGVLAISTGTLILAAAGHLQGKAATGHWLARRELSQMGADVQLARITQTTDCRIVTASGANSALLAAEQLAQRVRWGPAQASSKP